MSHQYVYSTLLLQLCSLWWRDLTSSCAVNLLCCIMPQIIVTLNPFTKIHWYFRELNILGIKSWIDWFLIRYGFDAPLRNEKLIEIVVSSVLGEGRYRYFNYIHPRLWRQIVFWRFSTIYSISYVQILFMFFNKYDLKSCIDGM